MSARRRDRKAARQLVAAQHRALVSAGVRTIVTCDGVRTMTAYPPRAVLTERGTPKLLHPSRLADPRRARDGDPRALAILTGGRR